jgi:hypothetical protein
MLLRTYKTYETYYYAFKRTDFKPKFKKNSEKYLEKILEVDIKFNYYQIKDINIFKNYFNILS